MPDPHVTTTRAAAKPWPYTVVHKDGTVSTFERIEDAAGDLKREYPYTWRDKFERAVLNGLIG